MNEINNAKIDNNKDIDVVMSMYNLIKYIDNYLKISGSLWKYYRDEPFLYVNGAITNFSVNKNNSASFKIKTKMLCRTGNNGTKILKLWYY